jgi:hypothetical protein
MRGGPGRTRTSNQAVMSAVSAPEKSINTSIFALVRTPPFTFVHGVSLVKRWSAIYAPSGDSTGYETPLLAVLIPKPKATSPIRSMALQLQAIRPSREPDSRQARHRGLVSKEEMTLETTFRSRIAGSMSCPPWRTTRSATRAGLKFGFRGIGLRTGRPDRINHEGKELSWNGGCRV